VVKVAGTPMTESMEYLSGYDASIMIPYTTHSEKVLGEIELALYNTASQSITTKRMALDKTKTSLTWNIDVSISDGTYYLGVLVDDHYLWGGVFETPQLNRRAVIISPESVIRPAIDQMDSGVFCSEQAVINLISQQEQPYQVVQPTFSDPLLLGGVGANLRGSGPTVVSQQEQPYQVVVPETTDSLLLGGVGASLKSSVIKIFEQVIA
jgi:hypothetical protein